MVATQGSAGRLAYVSRLLLVIQVDVSVSLILPWYAGGYIEVAFALSDSFQTHGQFYVQLTGNLYRNGKFAELFGPFANWDYNTCSGSKSDGVPWGASFEQKISACP